VFFYQSTLREAVLRFKYDGLTVLATPLGELMAAYWREHPLPADVFVPIPLHPARVRERGYNQSELLTQAMARDQTVPVDVHSVVRRRATAPQIGLSAGERAQNVRGAFECLGEGVVAKDVLLIDDVVEKGTFQTLSSPRTVLTGFSIPYWSIHILWKMNIHHDLKS